MDYRERNAKNIIYKNWVSIDSIFGKTVLVADFEYCADSLFILFTDGTFTTFCPRMNYGEPEIRNEIPDGACHDFIVFYGIATKESFKILEEKNRENYFKEIEEREKKEYKRLKQKFEKD